MTDKKSVIVIGAGAAGLMAAGRAAECGADVLLLEKTAHAGNKLLISGQSRCNLTNARELDEFIAAYGPGGRFLYRVFDRFFRDELIQFLKNLGVETKTEADGRIFPTSNSSIDVLAAFEKYLSNGHASVETQKEVGSIAATDGKVTGVRVGTTEYPCSAVILATGGASYPQTGSSGAGYRVAAALGHRIVKLRPALVPLVVADTETVGKMQGVSLSGVRITAFSCNAGEIPTDNITLKDAGRGMPGKTPRSPVIESRTGDVLITHYGLSGPAVLLMSLAVVDALEKGPVSIAVDLRPSFTWEQVRVDLQKRFDQFSKRNFRNILLEVLPPKMVDALQRMSGVAADKVGSQINAEEREQIVKLIKSLRFNIRGPMPLAEAMVTAGGVSLDEIDPRTMESKLIKGLYFCGEVMDIDADTGGYNLQAAFSTGHLAGESAAAFVTGSG